VAHETPPACAQAYSRHTVFSYARLEWVKITRVPATPALDLIGGGPRLAEEEDALGQDARGASMNRNGRALSNARAARSTR
jgi:hypothetical protein